jgi:carboxymethylenebutenolidase
MLIIDNETVDLATATGPMRTHVFRPSGPGRFPGVVLYSEIFQVTGPIRRIAAALAGAGFHVLVPEVYHEFLEAGAVLGYDAAGATRGNELKVAKALAAYDADAAAAVAHLAASPTCTGRVATFGLCLGGCLAFRAAAQAGVAAAVCFYATDLHKRSLGEGGDADTTLAACAGAPAELLMVWGRQDPHVPLEGRRAIYDALSAAGRSFEWHEFNAAHAFMRDEASAGRYNPELAALSMGIALAFLRRHVGGSLP